MVVERPRHGCLLPALAANARSNHASPSSIRVVEIQNGTSAEASAVRHVRLPSADEVPVEGLQDLGVRSSPRPVGPGDLDARGALVRVLGDLDESDGGSSITSIEA